MRMAKNSAEAIKKQDKIKKIEDIENKKTEKNLKDEYKEEKATKKETTKKKKKKRYHDPVKNITRVIAFIMAVCMVFAVAATCIFYLKYYYL